jgi:hypothetical protein
MGDLYVALVKAGAGVDSARKAAEEVANFRLRPNALEARIDGLEAKMDARFQSLQTYVDGRFTILSWMVTTNMAVTLGVLALLLRTGGAR